MRRSRGVIALMGLGVIVGLGAGSAFALEKVNEADLQTARGESIVTVPHHECVFAKCRSAPPTPQCYFDAGRGMCVKETALWVWYCDPFTGRKCNKWYGPVFRCCLYVQVFYMEVAPPCYCNTDYWEGYEDCTYPTDCQTT